MNSKLSVIKQITNEILNVLACNVELQKLLILDNYDLNGTSPFIPLSPQELIESHYICLTPQNEDGIQKLGRNTFVILSVDNIDFKYNTTDISAMIGINIITHINTALIENCRDRALEIADVIITTLDQLKLSASAVLAVDLLDKVAYSPFYSGYILNFSVSNQNSVSPLYTDSYDEDDVNINELNDEDDEEYININNNNNNNNKKKGF